MKATSPEAKEIWSSIKEFRKDMEESRKEWEESRKEWEERSRKDRERSRKEWEKGMQELRKSQREASEQIKKFSTETNKKIKENNEGLKRARELFETQWGRLMESLVEGDLVKILNEKGIDVKNTYMNIKSEYGEDRYEYDIVAGNGEEVVVVEVKTTLRVKHTKYFLEEIKKFPNRVSAFKKNTIYGAVAYLRAEEEANKYAEKQGLFVIKATGSSASIINRKDFKPKSFSKAKK